MVKPQRYNVADAVRRLNYPTADASRLLSSLVGSGGSVKFDGSSWMHFSSTPLLEAGVIESIEGFFVPGPNFEDYLIEKKLTDLHSAYVRADRFGGVEIEEASVVTVEAFSEALSGCQTSTQKIELAIEWVSALVDQVENLTAAVEGLIDREFGDDE
jgi:hypothetical protein